METVMHTATAKRVRSVRPVGTRAVLAELDGLQDVLALQDMLNKSPLPGQVDVLAAAETVMVVGESAAATRAIGARLMELELFAPEVTDSGLVVIDTVYDGDDLADVAELTGLSLEGVVAAHTGQVWTVAFAGFAPGFGYMVGENEALTVPRRSSPRTAVPAGSVALGGQYSAVYPRRSPGGWQLIGRTGARMWDLDRAQPALVRPGDRVQYRAVREVVTASDSPVGEPDKEHHTESGLRILNPGAQSLIQDLGRRGYGPLGVSAAGALDRASLRRANRLVGNASSAAAIESVNGGLTVEAVGDQVIAVTGAPVALTVGSPSWVESDDGDVRSGATRTVPMAAPFALLDGEVLTLGAPESGFRNYVAIRGGVDVPEVLGSRSADTMSGIGPAPLVIRQVLKVGHHTASTAVGAPELQPDFPGTGVTVLDVVPGPRADWFNQDALDSLCAQEWLVTPQSNRVGMRLDGTPLKRTREGELPSEGTMAGALQIPPAGLPVLFLADHPITGGYPVIGVVRDEHLDLAAQVPIGGKIRFRLVPDSPSFTTTKTPEK
ncbi:5-oxoprolinase/urea amidolyase family protein [Paenarthrobacter aurescens]|uniref:Allophanate hydrolase n=1 Tax=Paenarthrobacter aurescens TaxID=43663 RepID=A0A4Y3NBT9_PAEAU|nr:5-oxoprolinase/urea amidolyase family protein [Paenarthrobacter aurescens]MDO6141742.1 5-oxoprolinase/urea amidolyase family protein [Paenarthrobacter aurescens]MDO6149505.1 5-oxoprolinase/urea amidolyase family protein [Paenarthrobacter aurescens]MDO6156791.1 5-oxoprolinase/urea amidolyase family protein [Paenarthrobacter aurescens]MDO6160777.1 5-oxoprolinase/urea amidolyase family protein [Paenarthrobacter aurescens]GEB18607.1 allophanate hydrolase [Paenarthrobacter aurescens]